MAGFDYSLNIDLGAGGASVFDRITDSILASGAQLSEHTKAFDIVTRDRLTALDLSPLLIYMIDTVPASVLPYLAEQFDVMGYKGWRFADTEQKKRDLIKQAIELHRYKGTPWSIVEAIKRIGFYDATVLEGGYGMYYNREAQFDRRIQYAGPYNIFNFRVRVDLGNTRGISAQQSLDILALVNEYKNVRSRLVDVFYTRTVVDTVNMSDEVSYVVKMRVEERFTGNNYDASIQYNKIHKFVHYTEEVTVVRK